MNTPKEITVPEEITGQALQQLIVSRFNAVLSENGTKPVFNALDKKLIVLLKEMGVEFTEAKCDFDLVLEQYLGIARDAFNEFPKVEVIQEAKAYQIFKQWALSDPKVESKFAGNYKYFRDLRPTEYLLVGQETLPQRETILFLYEQQPHLISFDIDRKESCYEVECYGCQASFIVSNLGQMQDNYLIFNCQGKTVTPTLEEIKLKVCRKEDLVFSPSLSLKIEELVTSFHSWHKSPLIHKWGYILIGRPGVGKTTIGGILAGVRPEGCTFIYAPASEISDSFQIERVFRLARLLAPCVLQIDDVDLISQDRESEKGGITSALMENLDGLQSEEKIFTLLTTNNPGGMEKAIINRAGRVSGKIIFDGFKECLGDLIELYKDKFSVKMSRELINQAVSDVPEEKRDLTPDEAKNVCIRLHLLYGDSEIESTVLAKVISDVFDAFHAAEYCDASYLKPKPAETSGDQEYFDSSL